MDDHTVDPSAPAPATGEPTGWLTSEQRWEHGTLRTATVYGIELFNDGAFIDSHDCFEAEWYNYGRGSEESKFLHGMVQVAAGTHKFRDRGNVAGMRSLFSTALTYFVGVSRDFYGVDVLDIRTTLTNAMNEPNRLSSWAITVDGHRPVAEEAAYRYVESITK